jgi:hypothetical protein
LATQALRYKQMTLHELLLFSGLLMVIGQFSLLFFD